MDDLLRRQWRDLRAWLEDVDALGRADVPTRLGELVVHGDDLARALDAQRHPSEREAVTTVATVLAVAYGEVAGRPPMVGSPLAWIRLAAGREPSEDPNLPLF